MRVIKIVLLLAVASGLLEVFAGCTTATSQLHAESQDHSVTVLATCGGGLDDSLSAKAKAELGNGGELSAERLSSVKATLINDGALNSADKLKAFDIFIKCALEVDKRIRDGQPPTSPLTQLTGRQWYLHKARYESITVTQEKEPPYAVRLTAVEAGTGKKEFSQGGIEDAYWIRFRNDGMVETNCTNNQTAHPEDVLFSRGCTASWTPANGGSLITVKNGSLFPPTFVADQAKFMVTIKQNKLVLTRQEGSHLTLVEGTFDAE
jgi:hypothetical protein